MKNIGAYILLCSNNRYYIGSTNDISRRFDEHQRGAGKATKNLRPLKLVFFQECDNLTKARQLEKKLKSKKSKMIIDKIVKEGRITMRW